MTPIQITSYAWELGILVCAELNQNEKDKKRKFLGD
jgi:hypothetical protein